MSDFKLRSLTADNKENVVKKKSTFTNKFKKIIFEGSSPCPWRDYLPCVKYDLEKIIELKEGVAELKDGRDRAETIKKGGGNTLSELDIAIQLGGEVKSDVDRTYKNLNKNRMKAAAAIAYITRLFVMVMNEEIEILEKHSKRHGKDLDNVVNEMVTFLDKTRNSKS